MEWRIYALPGGIFPQGLSFCVFCGVALKVSVAVSVELWYMFVLQGGERMKYKLLKDLYDCFYTPPELSAQKQEIEECH